MKDFFLVCLSQHSVSKVGFFQAELREGYEVLKQFPTSNIYFIPIRLDDCEIPFEISDYQWIDLFASNALENLLKALQHEWNQRGFIWPRASHADLATPLYEEHEIDPFGSAMAFGRHLVFLRERGRVGRRQLPETLK